MQKKYITLGSLALLNIVIVGNLQVLPSNALYGPLLPFLYLCAIIGFFIPCVLMVAELATSRPQTGGAYIWCEQAFGPKIGFFVICILWLANLLWYPSIFSLIATNFAYLIDTSLVANKYFIIIFSIILFWLFTALNCVGVRFSTRASVVCSIIGIICPIIMIIAGGIYWLITSQADSISFNYSTMVFDFSKDINFGALIGIVISLFGIEVTAVHAGNVIKPGRTYPLSLLIASVIIILGLLSSELSIATIIPHHQLNVITGLFDAMALLFKQIHLNFLLQPVLLLILIGNIGSISAWMLGSTRGMHVGCQRNNLFKFLIKTNKYESPIGILICEAFIFTIFGGVFLIFPDITQSFWLMLVLASQVSLIYYIILFLSAIRLRYLPADRKGFKVPGGNLIFWIIMLMGVFTSLIALSVGFIPPPNLSVKDRDLFHLIMVLGLTGTCIVPFLVLYGATKKNKIRINNN